MAVEFWRPPGDIFGPPTNIFRNNIFPSRMAEKSSPDSFSCSTDDASDPPQVEPGISIGTLETPVSSTSNSLSQAAQATPVASSSALSSASSAEDVGGTLSLPSTSSGLPGEYLPPLRGPPPSPPLDLLIDDDLSDRMEFNNNNGNAPNFMWLEENNNTALIDLNAVEPRRGQMLDEMRDSSETEDMDL